MNFKFSNAIIVVEWFVDHQNAFNRIGENERVVLVATLWDNAAICVAKLFISKARSRSTWLVFLCLSLSLLALLL